MTNLDMLINELTGMQIAGFPDRIQDDALRMIACPFEAVEDPDALEIEGCPSETQCAACKRAWLRRYAE